MISDENKPRIILESIRTRRSIRKFTREKVSKEHLRCILESAMFAPSAVNKQPWNFIVIDERQTLDAIPAIHSAAAMAAEAPLAILVCGNRDQAYKPEFMDQDCSAAIMNILHAAHGLGLGAVWCGVHPSRERSEGLSELLHIPKHISPFGLVVIGHPASSPTQPERWNPAMVYSNRWGKQFSD